MEKNELYPQILKLLKDSPWTSVESILTFFDQKAKEEFQRKEADQNIGLVKQYTFKHVYLSKNDGVLINEIIWNLIIERVLTPSNGEYGLFDLPKLCVTDEEKLDKKIAELK